MNESEPLGLLLDHTQDKIVLLDEAGTFVYLNGAVERILGFTPDELVGENAFEYVHPDEERRVRRAFRRVIESDGFAEETVEYRHGAADGSWVWLESRMSNLTDSALDGFVVSSRDVTDRVEAERERAETASHLREIAAVSGDVLWMFNADWSELLFVNPAYEDVYGGSVSEVTDDPKAFLDTVHPDDVPAVEEAMGLLSEGTPVDMEYRVNPDEGYSRWIWVQGEPITVDGEVVRITGFTRDITDRRRRERQLVVMDNLLRHNLRNDLNVILGTAEVLEDVPNTAEHTAVIRRVGEQLLETAEKEREIIDLITGQGNIERIRLDEAVTECVAAARDRYPHASIEVSTLDPVAVEGCAELRAAVIELLENAIRHADGDDPTVGVRLRRTPEHAELVIRDDHTPIPAIEANVLTGDHDMTDVYHSSGLGFWLVYWCVEISNGSITVESGADRGNEITVRLPGIVD
ncbi:PAS domain S-box protein [Halorubrum sp. AD140]|uniref:PAS domain-containing sensor histidine kinase n=1 Tax=Halorubrum sp. AD140 TaxID=3050073 RepID=UPI002ACC4C5C|nr:PAS domain S-box protein [Halorubrum sp. AD140]MDZ5811020.1 PAS domain S-box protein [Halorubrum sp. AD140]